MRENREYLDILHGAMEMGQIKAYYQPGFKADGFRIACATAVCRWDGRDGGSSPPSALMPRAEGAHAACLLDWYMADLVCGFISGPWPDTAHNVPIALPLSWRHIYEHDSPQRLSQIADAHGVEKDRLMVSFSEGALWAHDGNYAGDILHIIEGFRSQGFRVVLSGFGRNTNIPIFASKIPFDVLELDRSLIHACCTGTMGQELLKHIFSYADRRGALTVADGVSRSEEVDFLCFSGCDILQGEFLCGPLLGDEFMNVLGKPDIQMPPPPCRKGEGR